MCFFEKDIIGGIHPSNDITILVMLTILPSIQRPFFLEEVKVPSGQSMMDYPETSVAGFHMFPDNPSFQAIPFHIH
jgi:hypothetical protein